MPPFPKDYATLYALIADVLPGADIDESIEGQVVIYTNQFLDESGNLHPIAD